MKFLFKYLRKWDFYKLCVLLLRNSLIYKKFLIIQLNFCLIKSVFSRNCHFLSSYVQSSPVKRRNNNCIKRSVAMFQFEFRSFLHVFNWNLISPEAHHIPPRNFKRYNRAESSISKLVLEIRLPRPERKKLPAEFYNVLELYQ